METRKLIYSNWIWFSISVILTLIVIWGIIRYVKNSHHPEDSYYFSVVDVDGIISSIHDSGIKPSLTIPGSFISLQILKEEYNNGKSKKINTPSSINLGMNPKDLRWNFIPTKVQDFDLYYMVSIQTPENNPFYGRKKEDPSFELPNEEKEILECSVEDNISSV